MFGGEGKVSIWWRGKGRDQMTNINFLGVAEKIFVRVHHKCKNICTFVATKSSLKELEMYNVI